MSDDSIFSDTWKLIKILSSFLPGRQEACTTLAQVYIINYETQKNSNFSD